MKRLNRDSSNTWWSVFFYSGAGYLSLMGAEMATGLALIDMEKFFSIALLCAYIIYDAGNAK